MAYLQEAFNQICKDAKPAEGYYVSLLEESSYYGGPEEGGWWGNDTNIVAYQYFPTEEEAEAAREAVEKLAQELEDTSNREHGEHCLRQMEWLEARGLDADYLPEDDGPSKFYVIVSKGLPEETCGPRHYE